MEALLTAAVALGRDLGPAICWGGAFVCGAAYAVRSARASQLDPRRAYWAAVIALAAGLVGGRLLGVVVYPAHGALTWGELLGGGHSWYGGLLGGALAALLYLRASGAPVLRHADALAPACALGYALGRVGCFLNGDDAGVVTASAFAVRYPPDTEAFALQLQRGLVAPGAALSSPVIPVQLLHAALGVLVFLLLRRPAAVPGRRLAAFAVAYGAGRFGLELLRGDFAPAVGPLSLHQALSAALVAAGAALLAGARARARAHRPAALGAEPS